MISGVTGAVRLSKLVCTLTVMVAFCSVALLGVLHTSCWVEVAVVTVHCPSSWPPKRTLLGLVSCTLLKPWPVRVMRCPPAMEPAEWLMLLTRRG